MYSSMNIPDQIEDNDGENHIHYDSHTLDDGGGGGGGVEDVSTDNAYGSGGVGHELSIPPCDDSSQLTLSFRGQVYVFDSVTPEKVQAVLLLLGGCELSSGSQGLEISPTNQRGSAEFPAKCSLPQRAASLIRFRQKRKERCFDKKVRYGVRQEVALRMQRNKGQFTSAKKQDGTNSWGADQDSVQDLVQSETSCTHCGTSSKSTPMMRRGPSGPRSLCNACGLFWANRGTLRDLSRRNHEQSYAPPEQVGEGNDLNCRTATPSHHDPRTATPTHHDPVDDKTALVVSDC
ncbi:GATA transcription factor 25-like [Lotus japonicus]|uniref:GATA transcription factor 25-like n=1 Tax=Lotus japonicus TaxID=34305 RepID=UPI00258F0D8E|nr:GATA transcription factor 25-like [Lotus japonicus]